MPASAFLGKKVLDDSGLAGSIDIYLMAQILILIVAAHLAARWMYNEFRNKGACHGGKCCAAHKHETSCGMAALFASGLACGATPCAPLLVVLSQAAVSTVWIAAASGMAFSIMGFLSPVLIWLVISWLLSKKMYSEIVGWMKWFQFICYILLAGI